ncbi:ABC transporter permease [Aerococcaceae bacterium zg-BR9]|uniref:ABC transporter permease n=1 Tax=Aerococcaceae bacterium zg-1292 TaxID=2774330 RepID=UPI0040631815|nr:ABC transporter permease [Aerococcaceae bacterium zg-BR9]MBF6626288.1 ABC transporter permease [Aerococcaceae bacterium zg-BR9]
MTQLLDLWSKRFRQFGKELGKYSRLIFNDHFFFILLVIIGFLLFFYREQLMVLNQMNHTVVKWPILIVAMGILGQLSLFGRPLWLMKEADKSYVFVQGERWRQYWQKGSLAGVVLPIIVNVAAVVVLYPFINVATRWSTAQLVMLVILQLLLVVWNHALYYVAIFKPVGHLRLWSSLVYTVWMILFTAILPQIALLITLIIVVVIVMFSLYWLRRQVLNWQSFEFTVEMDLKRQAAFYKWIAFFADVPNQRPVIHSRHTFNGFIQRLSQNTRNRDYYLLLRVLFRNHAFSGIWVRVLAFFSILMLLTQNHYLVMGLGMVSFILTIIQLLPMIELYEANPFQMIYPQVKQSQQTALQQVLRIVVCIQLLVFVVIAAVKFGTSITFGLVLASWVLVAVVLIEGYVRFWYQKQQSK